MAWEIAFHTPALEKEIRDMPAGFAARFIRCAERMELYGPDLGMPHSRAMGAGLFELRLKAAEGIARVFYCTLAGRRMVMLHRRGHAADFFHRRRFFRPRHNARAGARPRRRRVDRARALRDTGPHAPGLCARQQQFALPGTRHCLTGHMLESHASSAFPVIVPLKIKHGCCSY